MRSASLAQLLAASLVLTFAVGCEDAVTPAPRLFSIEVSHPTLTFSESLQTQRIDYAITDASGAPVDGLEVTWASSNEGVAIVSSRGVVTSLANGESTITLRTLGASAYIPVVVEAPATPLTDGVLVTGLADRWRGWRYFSYDVPAGHPLRVLEVRLNAGTGWPELAGSLCSTYSLAATSKVCVIGSPPVGTQTLAVHAYRDYEGASLQVRMRPLIGLTDGTSVSGISGAQGDLAYFTIDLPAASRLQVTASGASGDVDLFSQPGTRFSLDALYGYDPTYYWGYGDGVPDGGWCRSVTGTTTESCTTATTEEATTVTIVLVGVEDFSDFSLTVEALH